jgi:hypothetical protein
MTQRRRMQLFAAITVGALAVVVAYVVGTAVERAEETAAVSAAGARAAPTIRPGDLLTVSRDRSRPGAWGRLMIGSGAERRVGRLTCERVDFRGGTGICLAQKSTFPARTFVARIFDARQRVTGEIGLQGDPSRARISPGGRYAASTTFVSGDSYADPGAFSTRTTIYDAHSARKLGELEDFAITRDGRRFRAQDFNFWGVTFDGDGGRFYATLATGDHHYLIRGDLRTRSATVIRDGVECPSLSPDRRRVAYKARVGSPWRWQFQVLDLRSGRVTALREARSVDDQIAWIDDRRVAYDVDETVMAMPADGSAGPALLATGANSPSAVG